MVRGQLRGRRIELPFGVNQRERQVRVVWSAQVLHSSRILTKDHTGALKKGMGGVDLIQQQSFECALLQLDGRAEVFQGRHGQQRVKAQQAHWLMVGRISLHYRTKPSLLNTVAEHARDLLFEVSAAARPLVSYCDSEGAEGGEGGIWKALYDRCRPSQIIYGGLEHRTYV